MSSRQNGATGASNAPAAACAVRACCDKECYALFHTIGVLNRQAAPERRLARASNGERSQTAPVRQATAEEGQAGA